LKTNRITNLLLDARNCSKNNGVLARGTLTTADWRIQIQVVTDQRDKF